MPSKLWRFYLIKKINVYNKYKEIGKAWPNTTKQNKSTLPFIDEKLYLPIVQVTC